VIQYALSAVTGHLTDRIGPGRVVAAAGGGCGMMVLPLLAAHLIQRGGWRVAGALLGLAALMALLACAAVMRRAPAAPTATPTW
jgi:MFS family permease